MESILENKRLSGRPALYRTARILAWVTIGYNLIEGGVSVFFGMDDDTLALFGFGVDSFVEVISGMGILHMIGRMRSSPVEQRDKFETTALRITGAAFFLLVIGLITGVALNLIYRIKPESTRAGVIISVISIGTMYYLMTKKRAVGTELQSDALIADANCTRTCFYLSFILLIASGLYEIFGIGYFDILGSLGIAFYAFKEGREAFEKASSGKMACCDEDDC